MVRMCLMGVSFGAFAIFLSGCGTSCPEGYESLPGGVFGHTTSCRRRDNVVTEDRRIPHATAVAGASILPAERSYDFSRAAIPPSSEIAVGFLLSTTEVNHGRRITTNIGFCSSFLIDADRALVATNAHCLPEDLQNLGASLSGRVSVIFGSGSQRTVFAANRVILLLPKYRSLDGRIVEVYSRPSSLDTLRDIAIIELAGMLTSPSLAISRRGLSRSPVFLQVLDPAGLGGGVYRMRRRAQECLPPQPLSGSSIGSGPFQKISQLFPIATASACRITPGNSGSPVLDLESGQVVGQVKIGEKIEDPPPIFSNWACLRGLERLMGPADPACATSLSY